MYRDFYNSALSMLYAETKPLQRNAYCVGIYNVSGMRKFPGQLWHTIL